MIDPEYRLDKDKAMAGLRTLVGEYHRVIEQAEHLAARLRLTHLKIGACLEAATGDPIAPAPAGDIELQVSVKHAGWRQFEQAISAIQARHAGITIDEACNDIFWLASSPYWRNATRIAAPHDPAFGPAGLRHRPHARDCPGLEHQHPTGGLPR